jgi:dipeptidyl aminopeptidase/acylaminoacyl peptidase
MLGVDDLLTRFPFVDGDRLGVTGGSCGGFLTTWIVGHTDRFKAAVTQRSVANEISFFGTSDIGPEAAYRETGAYPWEDAHAMWRQSPLAHVERIHTPLLIIHSDEDHRCAIEQARQLFAALAWLRRDVEFVWFEGEGHGLSRGGRPMNRIERLRRILGWFATHLGAAPVPTTRKGCESAC